MDKLFGSIRKLGAILLTVALGGFFLFYALYVIGSNAGNGALVAGSLIVLLFIGSIMAVMIIALFKKNEKAIKGIGGLLLSIAVFRAISDFWIIFSYMGNNNAGAIIATILLLVGHLILLAFLFMYVLSLFNEKAKDFFGKPFIMDILVLVFVGVEFIATFILLIVSATNNAAWAIYMFYIASFFIIFAMFVAYALRYKGDAVSAPQAEPAEVEEKPSEEKAEEKAEEPEQKEEEAWTPGAIEAPEEEQK